MPPLPSVPGVIRLSINGTDSGGFPWANVLHFKYSGPPPSASDLNVMATETVTSWVSNLTPLQASNLTLGEVIALDLSSPSANQGSLNSGEAGTRTGSFLPASAAFLISYPALSPRYRGGHPRQYLNVGVQADLADEAHWHSAFLDAVVPAFATLRSDILAASYTSLTLENQCAVSYYTTDYTTHPPSRVRRAVPLVYDIHTLAGNLQLASQRSRIGRRRR